MALQKSGLDISLPCIYGVEVGHVVCFDATVMSRVIPWGEQSVQPVGICIGRNKAFANVGQIATVRVAGIAQAQLASTNDCEIGDIIVFDTFNSEQGHVGAASQLLTGGTGLYTALGIALQAGSGNLIDVLIRPMILGDF